MNIPLIILRWSGLWVDVFDVRENAERGEDNSDDCNKLGWRDDEFSFIFICSDLICDGDKIKFELVCFVWSIRILFVILAAPLGRIADGEFISCLHAVELVIKGGNGWESVCDDNSSVFIRKPDVPIVDVESDDSKNGNIMLVIIKLKIN